MKKSNVVPFKKQKTKEWSLKKKIGINILAILIAVIALLISAFVISEIQRKTTGFENKEELITTYFNSLNSADEKLLKKCFYPTAPSASDDIKDQIEYAKSESENTSWKIDELQTEWDSLDKSAVHTVLTSVQIDDAVQCIVFAPLEQKLESGITVLEEDIYQFYVHETKGRWYIAAFRQTSRNVTGAIKEDGTKMTNDEVDEWLTSMSIEIGSDKVGYLFVDQYWQEVTDDSYDDDQIKTYITSDYSSYMTMAVINDSDIDDFQEYSSNIIKNSKQDYGDIITSEGVIGDYPTEVQIAQNEESGARIIVWTFKISENDDVTHVITLEAMSDYDASTYINTFHLAKEKTDESASDGQSSETDTENTE